VGAARSGLQPRVRRLIDTHLGPSPTMRPEIQSTVDEIQQVIGLLRRHL
jgi:hypothetical protein